MKAWILHDINDLRLENRREPVPGMGEVLVAVKAAGICGSDIPRIYKTGAHVHPLVPGHEFSGVVTAVGPGAGNEWMDRRVGIFPLIPCGRCAPCFNKQYEMCRNYDYLGSRRDGGFAEYVAVPASNLITMPENVSFEEAAMLEPMAVAAHAMRRVLPEEFLAREGNKLAGNKAAGNRTARDKPASNLAASDTETDTVAVYGLGTIGLLLVMLLLERRKACGQSSEGILVIGNKDFQKQKILELGLSPDAYCDSRKQEAVQWLMERTDGRGAKAVFECVGRNETFGQAVDSAAPGGRICLLGNPASDMTLEKSVYWKILRNQLTLTGTWNSSFTHENADDWYYVTERLSAKKIAPESLISHRLSMEELEYGLHIMRDKSEDYGKVMVRMR